MWCAVGSVPTFNDHRFRAQHALPQIDLSVKKGIMPGTLDIMELNTTNYYHNESDPSNNDVQVLASNYLAYKVGKLYSSQVSDEFLINLVKHFNSIFLDVLSLLFTKIE